MINPRTLINQWYTSSSTYVQAAALGLGTRVDVAGRSWCGVSSSGVAVLWIPACVCMSIGVQVMPSVLAVISVSVALCAISVALVRESTVLSQLPSDSACYSWLLLCEVIAFGSVYTYSAALIGDVLSAYSTVVSVSTIMAAYSLLVLLVVTLLAEYSVRSLTINSVCSGVQPAMLSVQVCAYRQLVQS